MLDQEFKDIITIFVPGAREALSDDSRLRDLGLDSMHSIDLLLAIEEKYDIEFPAHLLSDASFDTAGSLWSVVQQIRSAGGTPVGPAGHGHA